MRRSGALPAAILSLLLLSMAGCATVIDGNDQLISVETQSAGAPISGARCVLRNDQGQSRLTTPGTAWVRYDNSDLKISCKRPGFDAGVETASSAMNTKVFGNLLIGGAIGFGLDLISGTAYKYPSTVVIELVEIPAAPATAAPLAARPINTVLFNTQLAASRDELRTIELVRRTACDPTSKPLLVQQEFGISQYTVTCQDGRTARAVCQPSECRFKTLGD